MDTKQKTEGEMETEGSGSLRTRSQVAPDWTIEESLILVNEISAVEGDCQNTLSSFQKWKMIVENCNALCEVNRSLNQCRRKWDSLLSDYKNKQLNSRDNFKHELFKAIDCYVKEREGRCDTDPDSDPEAFPDPLLSSIAQSVSKKQRHRMIPYKRSAEGSLKPKRRIKSEQINSEECSSEERVELPTNDFDERTRPEESNTEEKEQLIAAELRENVELINALVQGHSSENTIDFTRHTGDKIIACLGNLADTLDQLCALVQ